MKVIQYYLKNYLHSYLSGHLFHHILGSLCVLEGLVGLGDLEAPADHSHLVHLSEVQPSQGALEARVFLTTESRQKDSFSQMCMLAAFELLKERNLMAYKQGMQGIGITKSVVSEVKQYV